MDTQEGKATDASASHYAHGYESILTLKQHTARTAARQGAFFLHYLQQGMTLLDCGCGSGSITVGLAEAVAPGAALGIDVSAVEIQRARARAAERHITNLSFEVGDIYRLEAASGSFDALFSHNVLEHLDRPDEALAEMRRVLKPGGLLGIRDCDIGGILLEPSNDTLRRGWALFVADWRSIAGDPHRGRQLPALVAGAGFVSLQVSGSYDVFVGEDAAMIGAERCREPDFVERVVAAGRATRQDLEDIRAAWLAWGRHPQAFAANAHIEVVARKPE